MKLTNIQSFLVVMAFIAFGGIIGKKTKSVIPGVFVIGACFLIGFWTVIPKDVVSVANFGNTFGPVAMSLLLVHLGTIMDLKKLLEQWKAVVISLVGVGGTILVALTIGRALYGTQMMVALTPPLTGGVIATVMITDALKAKGFMALAAFPICMMIGHSFLGYPIISLCLKKEGNRLLKVFRANGSQLKAKAETAVASEVAAPRKKLIPPISNEYQSPEIILVKIALVGILGAVISTLINGAISQYVIDLILGVIFCELGFLEESALQKAGVFNWLIAGLLATVFANLGTLSPSQVGSIIAPIAVTAVLGIIGMAITSAICGKFLGYSKEMAFACALTSLCGFPSDYIITHEASKNVATTEDERLFLVDEMLPKMLVGGFATVSVASVIIAGIMVKLL